jgi:hypothetical protein
MWNKILYNSPELGHIDTEYSVPSMSGSDRKISTLSKNIASLNIASLHTANTAIFCFMVSSGNDKESRNVVVWKDERKFS